MEARGFFANLLLLAAGVSLAASASWDYYDDHDHGIYHWHDSYPACSGQRQSPIHIHSKVAEEMTDLNTLTLTGYDALPTAATASTMVNNGHTIQVAVNHAVTMSNGGLPAGTFNLAQYHLHWGSGNNNGSEHWVNGGHFAAELHLVHVNSKYSTPTEYLNNADGLAVVGVIIEIGGADNPGYENLISKLGSIPNKDSSNVTLDLFRLDDLLPTNRTVFFRYDGSLTTPPCSEVVTWTLFENPIQISQTQVNKLRTMLSALTTAQSQNSSYEAHPIYDNHRLPMPINDRTIYVNKVASVPTCSATAAITTGWITLTLMLITSWIFNQH